MTDPVLSRASRLFVFVFLLCHHQHGFSKLCHKGNNTLWKAPGSQHAWPHPGGGFGGYFATGQSCAAFSLAWDNQGWAPEFSHNKGAEGDRALRGYHQPTGEKPTTMFKTSYLREVRKEKYERSDVFDEEPDDSESSAGISAIQGWESLQELNSRFARYINRARVLEQRNAVFRKQLETLQRMEEASGLQEAFTEQIDVNRQRIRELSSDHSKLERELRDACRMLDEFTSK